MVTLPPEHKSPTSATVHTFRRLAESFGTDAQRYDRARPTYPRELADRIVETLPGRRVLDVGIGTGLSARPFRDAGCTVTGVETDPRMAEVARGHGFDIEVAAFEDWDPAGRRFDAVVAGQTWHWIDPLAGAAKAADVLDDGGRIALFWNHGEPPAELAAEFAAAFRDADTGLPFRPWEEPATDPYRDFLDRASDGLRRSGAFTEPEEWRIRRTVATTRDAWLDQVPTGGGFNRLPQDKLDAMLRRMGEAIDAVGGSFPLVYTTVVTTATRRD